MSVSNLIQTPTFLGPSVLSDFVETCALSLFATVHDEFIFPIGCSHQNWPVEAIMLANETFLKTLRRRANVYAIFICPSGTELWKPVYVGERKSLCLRQRMTQHLIKKGVKTSSMLEKVKTAVVADQRIGLSFIKIEPEPLRLFVEETILDNYKDKLIWNTHT